MKARPSLRAAIVGCGRISTIHLSTLKAMEHVEVVALCDLDEQLCRERAREFSVAGVYTDFEKMLDEARPDVVHILTPPATHAPLAEAAARCGAQLYIEKPLAGDEAQARRIIAVAEQSGVTVCPGHNRLFDPIFLRALKFIEEGRIGRVLGVRAEQGFSYEGAARGALIPWSYTYDWGIFDNLMIHPLYLAGHFLAEPGAPRVAGFRTDRVREAGIEEVRVLLPSAGCVAEISLSLTGSPEQNRVEVVGTTGRVVVDFVTLTVQCESKSPLPSLVTRFSANLTRAAGLIWGVVGNVFAILTGRMRRYPGIRNLIAEYYRRIAAGQAPPVTAEDGLRTVMQLDEIKRACRDLLKQRPTVAAGAPTRPAEVLVTGATGLLGGRVVDRLSANGIATRALARLPARARDLPHVEWVQADLDRESDLEAALSGVRHIVHCAAMVGAPGSLESYRRANVDAVLRLARCGAAAGAETFVHLSSIGVYGAAGGRHALAEDAAYEPFPERRGFYTQTKLEGERALIESAGRGESPPVVILRPGTIYGPGMPLPIARLTLLNARPRPLIAGGPRIPMPLIYVDNVVDAILASFERQPANPAIYNLVDETDLDQGGVRGHLDDLTQGRLRPIGVPYPLVWLMLLGVDLLHWVRRREFGTARYRLHRTLARMRIDCQAARRDLQWKPAVTVRDGLQRSLEAEHETPFPH